MTTKSTLQGLSLKMKIFNRSTGNTGENLATAYLKEKGYQILERNFHTRFGEIDIICSPLSFRPESQRSGGITPIPIIFVEVKTKITNKFGYPEEMVNRNKLSKVSKMAEIYLTQKGLNNKLCRIDVIAIILNANGSLQSLNHHENLY